jgi:hypothetical protein
MNYINRLVFNVKENRYRYIKYPKKCFTLGRNETATFATSLYNRAGRVSRITWCHYHFPEIKSFEVDVCRYQNNENIALDYTPKSA